MLRIAKRETSQSTEECERVRGTCVLSSTEGGTRQTAKASQKREHSLSVVCRRLVKTEKEI
jgi:hypothetical protein